MARGGWFRKQSRNGASVASVPDGLWSKCPRCGEISFARDVERNLNICPKCEYHHLITADQRIMLTCDEGSFTEMDTGISSINPLAFPDYDDKLNVDRTKTGRKDAIVTGLGAIDGNRVYIGIAEFGFRAGSMGGAVGEKIVRLFETALSEKTPVVLFTASGGARMQEGLLSLMQMAKTSAATAKLDQARIPYIVVITHPTTGGVFASYAALGDIIIAEPGATVGLAGRRVGNQDMGVKLPEDFQTSEFQYRCGMVDQIVHRKEVRSTLGKLLMFLSEAPVYAK